MCGRCQQSKPLADFYAPAPGKKRRPWCIPCHKEYNRERNSRPEKKAAAREGHLRKNYGITTEVYDALVKSQNGKCPICGEVPPTKLVVDHCHATNTVRGLICFNCNIALGFYERLTSRSGLTTYLEPARIASFDDLLKKYREQGCATTPL